jgi:uncharacterized FlaG/YvyC family protein
LEIKLPAVKPPRPETAAPKPPQPTPDTGAENVSGSRKAHKTRKAREERKARQAQEARQTRQKSQERACPQAAERLPAFDRALKYEVLKDAGIVQIQVIDTSDGSIVRKIPADEIVRFIETLKERLDDQTADQISGQIDDQLDVLA